MCYRVSHIASYGYFHSDPRERTRRILIIAMRWAKFRCTLEVRERIITRCANAYSQFRNYAIFTGRVCPPALPHHHHHHHHYRLVESRSEKSIHARVSLSRQVRKFLSRRSCCVSFVSSWRAFANFAKTEGNINARKDNTLAPRLHARRNFVSS